MYSIRNKMSQGATMLPPRVLEALGSQVIYPQTKEFEEFYDSLEDDLRYVFQTKNLVMVFTSSGTGAMESTIVNMFSADDKVLVLSTGVFGDRYADIAQQFGLKVDTIAAQWGNTIDVLDVQQKLIEDVNNEIKAIIMTHNESSTGVTNDVEAISKLTRNSERLLIVDANSSLGAIDLKMDAWGVDAVVTGSHKSLMAPPGLSFVSLSDKALKACQKATLPRFYWDYRKYKKVRLKEASESPPYTPAISLMVAQSEALKMIREEGLENVFQRHKKLALAVQEGILSLGLKLFPKREVSSYILTSIHAPQNIDMEKAKNLLNSEYNIIFSNIGEHLSNTIIKISHCGYVNKFDLIKTFSALENMLEQQGHKFERDCSVNIIQKLTR